MRTLEKPRTHHDGIDPITRGLLEGAVLYFVYMAIIPASLTFGGMYLGGIIEDSLAGSEPMNGAEDSVNGASKGELIGAGLGFFISGILAWHALNRALGDRPII